MTPMRDLLRFIAEHGGGFPVAQLSAEETRLALDCERELFLYRKRNSQSDDWCLTSKGLRAVADLNRYAVIKPTPPVSGDGC